MTTLNNKYRLALIGLGSQGRKHLKAAKQHSRVQIVAAVDSDPATRQSIASEHPEMRLFDRLESLKAESMALDGLILALPHHAYSGIWKDLVALRVPILKEKPLGRNYPEAMEFFAQAKNAGCLVQTAIQRRHGDSYQYLRKYLDDHTVSIREIHAHYYLGRHNDPDDETWRQDFQKAGGGALLDMGYHLVDLLIYLVGPFDVISATLFDPARLQDGRLLESRAWVTGRSESCWVMLDVWRHGDKGEEIRLLTDKGVIRANRTGVWLGDKLLQAFPEGLDPSLTLQLDRFADLIGNVNCQQELIWDQFPAMRTIDEAYRLASAY